MTRVHSGDSVISHVTTGEVSGAEHAAERGGDWRVLVRAAVRLTAEGSLTRAEQFLMAASRLRPEQPEVMLALGRLRARQGALIEAECLLREAWELNRGPVPAAAFARFLARDGGRYRQALELLTEAATRHPRSALLECVRGELLLEREAVTAARRCFERALGLDRNSRAARLGLARTLVAEAIGWVDHHEPTRGLFLLRRAAGLDASWALPHRAMALAFDAIGCRRLARRARKKATALA